MVDEVAKLGELLKLPNLEDETITLINATMRKIIGEIKPFTPAQTQDFESVMNEWIHGKKEGDE